MRSARHQIASSVEPWVDGLHGVLVLLQEELSLVAIHGQRGHVTEGAEQLDALGGAALKDVRHG